MPLRIGCKLLSALHKICVQVQQHSSTNIPMVDFISNTNCDIWRFCTTTEPNRFLLFIIFVLKCNSVAPQIFQYWVPIIQCVPEKRKPINQVHFSENCNDLSEKVYIVTKFSLSSFDTRCIGHAWPSTKHFKLWCQNWFAQNRNLRAYNYWGLPRFTTKGRVEKTFISIYFVSFVIFLLLRLLILTWIS